MGHTTQHDDGAASLASKFGAQEAEKISNLLAGLRKGGTSLHHVDGDANLSHGGAHGGHAPTTHRSH